MNQRNPIERPYGGDPGLEQEEHAERVEEILDELDQLIAATKNIIFNERTGKSTLRGQETLDTYKAVRRELRDIHKQLLEAEMWSGAGYDVADVFAELEAYLDANVITREGVETMEWEHTRKAGIDKSVALGKAAAFEEVLNLLREQGYIWISPWDAE